MNIILYHAHCTDGTGAALAAWLHLGDDDTHYQAVTYGTGLPELPPHIDWAGAYVHVLDFCFTPEQTLTLAQCIGRLGSLHILDHHATAYEALCEAFTWDIDPKRTIGNRAQVLGLPEDHAQIKARFSDNHSGAVLAWQHWHGSDNVPRLLELIEDRDRWTKRYPDSDPLHYALQGRDYHSLKWLLDLQTLNEAISNGRIIHDYLRRQWAALCDTAAKADLFGTGTPVAVLNCPHGWASDCAHLLLTKHQDIDIAACYADEHRTGLRHWSLRSRPNGPHCGHLAKAHGGGGHHNAAGFEEPITARLFAVGAG
jgi:oligoribonuclease NrnB/cAMP/cGMP phosphodiesterase (DHH superfamily)